MASAWADLGLPAPNSGDYGFTISPGIYRTPFPTFKPDQARQYAKSRKTFTLTVELDRTQLKIAEDYLRATGFREFGMELITGEGRLVETAIRLIEPYRVTQVGFRTWQMALTAEAVSAFWTGQTERVEDAELSTLYTSSEWLLPASVPVGSVLERRSGQVRYKPPGGGGNWTQWVTTNLIVEGGGMIQIRQTSASGYEETVTADVRIGGVAWRLIIETKEFQSVFTVLHSFTGDAWYVPSPTIVDSTVYGATNYEGENGSGAIYSFPPFSYIYEFPDISPSDSWLFPSEPMTIVGSLLYGMTKGSAPNDYSGIIFSLGLAGSGFTSRHVFDGNPEQGYGLNGGLLLLGGVLYGTTTSGGVGSIPGGTVFSINPDGTNHSVLHSFSYDDVTNLAAPFGSLVANNGKLYGIAYEGGEHLLGGIYSISTDGTGFSIIHSFNGSDPQNTYTPEAGLVIHQGVIYGTTFFGGTDDTGTIYSLQPDGSGFTILHSFNSNDQENGYFPIAPLTVVGNRLYGSTDAGGAYGFGTIFSIGLSGEDFRIEHSFIGWEEPGGAYAPAGTLALSNGLLYGVTRYGGEHDCGVLFSLSVPV